MKRALLTFFFAAPCLIMQVFGASLTVDGDLTVGTTTNNTSAEVPYGSLFLGTNIATTNARLVLKAKSNGFSSSLIEFYNLNGDQTLLMTDGGNLFLKRGMFTMSDPNNSRTIALNPGSGYIDGNEVLFLNRLSSAPVYISNGGGRVGIGTASVTTARVAIISPETASASDAVLRMVGRSGQTGNLLEVQKYGGTNTLIVNKDGKLGLGTNTPAANMDVKGSVRFERQGDIEMGDFGNPP